MAVLPDSGKTEGPVLLEQALLYDVVTSDDYVTLTGVYSQEATNEGWRWDRRLVPSENLEYTRHNEYLGGHSHGLLDGTNLEDWVSGVYNRVAYQGLTYKSRRDRLQWVPQVDVGNFTIFWDSRPLFSDYSVSNNMRVDRIANGVFVLDLPGDAVHESTTVRIYQRLDSFNVVTHREYEYTAEFTGELSGSVELATVDDDGNILYGNIAARRNEFVIEDDVVICSNSNSKLVGNESADLQVIKDTWEPAGKAQPGRQIYGKFFPFDVGSVRLASVDAANNLVLYEAKTTLNYSEATDLHFAVDYDLGVITVGGKQAGDLVLAAKLDATSTEVKFYYDLDTRDQYPDTGIIEIGSEKILYTEKQVDGFAGLVRGYKGTNAQVHAQGTKISDVQHGARPQGELYISYTAVPRVDYEVSPHTLRTANRFSWLDIRATNVINTNDIFQLYSYDINLARIELTIDRPLIGGELYGPVKYGTDTARLTATAYDYEDNPVPDIELTIYIEAGIGVLNNGGTSVTGTTNSLGQIYAYYNAPYSDDDAFIEVLETRHSGTNTVMRLDRLAPGADLDDIWVFQVLKHDPLRGTTGLKLEVADAAAHLGYVRDINGWLEVDGVIGEDYEGGLLYVVQTTGVTAKFNIVKVEPVFNGSNEPQTRVYTKEVVVAARVIGQDARLIQRDALEWDPGLKRGARVILYEWSTGALHPLTKVAGAYTPLHPDNIADNEITFNDRNLPLPAPNDNTENLGAYVVVAPSVVTFRAKGIDPYSGRVILSNRVKAQLELPNFLTGVDKSGILPVPYGFTFVTESFNVGAGLGGANFITINPAASGINQFNIYRAF